MLAPIDSRVSSCHAHRIILHLPGVLPFWISWSEDSPTATRAVSRRPSIAIERKFEDDDGTMACSPASGSVGAARAVDEAEIASVASSSEELVVENLMLDEKTE